MQRTQTESVSKVAETVLWHSMPLMSGYQADAKQRTWQGQVNVDAAVLRLVADHVLLAQLRQQAAHVPLQLGDRNSVRALLPCGLGMGHQRVVAEV